jgi:hypothetical protein
MPTKDSRKQTTGPTAGHVPRRQHISCGLLSTKFAHHHTGVHHMDCTVTTNSRHQDSAHCHTRARPYAHCNHHNMYSPKEEVSAPTRHC